ncbi:hypothetical protein KKJ06_18365 [Xenorhabdus bovienii]|uniref:phage baseplate protein n=1 Tax=Xenorhabdus bovienii TaxID=40576 RepID=UPI0023B353EA|nr:hypothetical protein [Xenorhabdus bovienii]MDE9483257.1 hypothetical protein [Xenorhabdus bovienii]MDE9536106.1 hypothetical protein [Xenorhabdus bovienii]MDE9552778.1 hypothetical protein [Xenorhabdus bovienii]MDE9557329.1 hypothetical protein [Xenorhabdus bovienii]MDE9589533.1 hypothetical protein [Xenorhabdus bovienii]
MFSLNQTTVMNAARGGGILSIINSILSPGYGIYYAKGKKAGQKPFSPTSFVSVEIGGEATITTAPLEKGTYASFNKVQRPTEIQVTFTVEGWTGFSGAIPNLTNFTLNSRTDVLETLEKMRTTAEIYDIETPDQVYSSYDLIKYDYRIRSDSGVTLLIVNAVFQAVMDVAEVTISGKTAQKQQQPDENSKASSMETKDSNGGTKSPTLTDVKKAMTGLGNSVLDAARQVTDKVGSVMQKAASTVTEPLSQAIIDGSSNLNTAVKDLAKSLT